VDSATQGLIDDLTSDIEDEDTDGAETGAQSFSKVDFRSGERGMKQAEYSFDPMAFTDEDEVKDQLQMKFSEDYPEAGKSSKFFNERVVIDMNSGTAIITFPGR